MSEQVAQAKGVREMDAATLRSEAAAASAAAAAATEREREAKAALEAAARERERAARAVVPAAEAAKRAQAEVDREADKRLASLERGQAAAAQQGAADTARPSPELRARARGWLHPAPGEGGANVATELATMDSVAGTWWELRQQAGRAMRWVSDVGATGDAFARADDLECAAWARFVARVRVIAGEV